MTNKQRSRVNLKQKVEEPAVLRKGKEFEQTEKGEWNRAGRKPELEKGVTDLKGKKGRIDIYMPQSEDGLVCVAEVKATDWDEIPLERIRPNVLRHARQIWRYIEAELGSGTDVSPGLVYPREPQNTQTKLLVEELLNQRFVQCVWRKPPSSDPLRIDHHAHLRLHPLH